jgi:hypothetical protein
LITVYRSFGHLRGSPTQPGIRAIERSGSIANDCPTAPGAEPIETRTPTAAGNAAPTPIPVDLERLIAGKESVDVPTSARYLELSDEHVRRLIRTGKLVRLGEGRIKVSTASLRSYKGK